MKQTELEDMIEENKTKQLMTEKAAEAWETQKMLLKRVANDFKAHAVSAVDSKSMADMRSICATLATWICHNVPPGREQTTALTKLEECMFHANAGIARNSIEGGKV